MTTYGGITIMDETATQPTLGGAARELAPVVEVWRPTESGDRLEWASGSYGPHQALQAESATITFAPGEGLPGMAWADRSPVLLDNLFQAGFVRDHTAREAGLTSGIAIPCLSGERLHGVVVFLCDHNSNAQGAFEVWRRNDRDELSLENGYHANLERFGKVSQYVKFPRGAGLPGKTREARFPQLIGNVGASKEFMRAAGAKAEGLASALSLPIMRGTLDIDSVVLMLSAAKTPIAHCFEIWAPAEGSSPTGTVWRLASGVYGPFVDLGPPSATMRLAPGQGLVGRAAQTGAPLVSTRLPDFEPGRGDQLGEYGLNTGVALPFYQGERIAAIVTMIR
ncbi:hypothetical protein Mal64_01510 [Pseudobythopirellula maris]|uniref:GAF domain-containing protein n=1 Tax=Pseudobythopirellula maris TaxID=2527991 RepID=A0A5C5ZQF7_9BACT|nr:GAF domain-containing protein [Pseudobythopirellula maris]TWT89772.1 hypothetical protein Mal64_01510 [Pseudobythopirellula maris]